MFYNCTSFDQDLSRWDLSAVPLPPHDIDSSFKMFEGARSFQAEHRPDVIDPILIG